MNQIYIFQREDGWYPLELKDDLEAQLNAELNHGTIRVENVRTKRVIWPPRRS